MAKQKAKKIDGRNQRADLWSFLLYPKDGMSAVDYGDIFDSLGLLWWVLSPLHDQDVYVKDGSDGDSTWVAGEKKKAHYHALFHFGVQSQKTWNFVSSVIGDFGGVRAVPGVSDRGSVRYMIHKDRPQKFQYRQEDITWGGEVDVGAFFESAKKEMTPEERVVMIGEMSVHIDREQVTEFDKFETWCRENNFEWYTLICKSAREHVRTKINSKRYWMEREEREQSVYPRTEKQITDQLTAIMKEVGTLADKAGQTHDRQKADEEKDRLMGLVQETADVAVAVKKAFKKKGGGGAGA
jgi:hypothetical protein